MAVRSSRAPLIPLKDPDKSVIGELFIKDDESMPKLLYKDKELKLIDIVQACLNPAFTKLESEFKDQHLQSVAQAYEPTDGQQIWFKTTVFDSIITDDEQL